MKKYHLPSHDVTYRTLSRTEFLPDAIIALNGVLPSVCDFQRWQDIPVFAADGAAGRLLNIGITPAAIVGDFDSFPPNCYNDFPSEKLFFRPDQNATDFEKTMDVAKELHYQRLLIVGFHGGELEHSLNNTSILLRYSQDTTLAMYETGRVGIVVSSSVQFSATPEELISLIPLPTALLSTTGLRWNLHNEELALGKREGARNRAESAIISLQVHNGCLLLFMTEHLSYMPVIKKNIY